MTRPLSARVTITGADDAVDPADLMVLSLQFPFVEWGILFSRKRSGEARYPSERWVARARQLLPRSRLAAHLCGEQARELMVNPAPSWFAELAVGFGRVQVNGFDATAAPGLAINPMAWRVELILQAREPAHLREALVFKVATVGDKSALFDPSGGRGLMASAWPAPPPGLRVGYAGGIGPANVSDALDRAAAVAGLNFWLDMETGVRVNDQFSLEAAADVLAKVETWENCTWHARRAR